VPWARSGARATTPALAPVPYLPPPATHPTQAAARTCSTTWCPAKRAGRAGRAWPRACSSGWVARAGGPPADARTHTRCWLPTISHCPPTHARTHALSHARTVARTRTHARTHARAHARARSHQQLQPVPLLSGPLSYVALMVGLMRGPDHASHHLNCHPAATRRHPTSHHADARRCPPTTATATSIATPAATRLHAMRMPA
jgi:hypothetical protein